MPKPVKQLSARPQSLLPDVPDGMKWCTKCFEAHPFAAFNARAKSKDGYQYFCRDSINRERSELRQKQIEEGVTPSSDLWNKANRDRINDWRTAKRREIRDYLRSLKFNQPCVDCNGIFPPTCMDWDHKDPAQKEFNICGESTREMYSKEKIDEEIAKCELVCANCHRIRSAVQRGEDPWQSY